MGEMAELYDYCLDAEDYSIVCNVCGKKNLHWAPHSGGWHLVNGRNQIHKCKDPKVKERKKIPFGRMLSG